MPAERAIRLRREAWGFAIGSLFFLIGAVPYYQEAVGPVIAAVTFFVGALFFTAAAFVQLALSGRKPPRRGGERPDLFDWWAAAIQFAGTLFFNVSTYEALSTNLSTGQEDRLIWAPDVFGCACFLIASALAWGEVSGAPPRGARRSLDWWIGVVNLGGSVAFAVAGVASFFIPDSGDILNLAAANVTTVIGALGFLAGALLMLVEGARAGIPDPLVSAGA